MDFSVILRLLDEVEKIWDKIINHFKNGDTCYLPLPESLMNIYSEKKKKLKEACDLFFKSEMDNRKKRDCLDLLYKRYMLLGEKIWFSFRYHSDLEKLIKELEMDCIQLSNFGFRLSSFLTLTGEKVDLYLVHTQRRMEFLIYLHDTNTCVGQINYVNNCPDGYKKMFGDVSYGVHELYRGNGYAGEALRVLAEYLYNVENVDSLYINAWDSNVASIRVIEKFGGTLYANERGKSCYKCDLSDILDKYKIRK